MSPEERDSWSLAYELGRQVARIPDDALVKLITRVERNSSIVAEFEQLHSFDKRREWALGEMVGFHPIHLYGRYCSLLDEAVIRNLGVVKAQADAWERHIPQQINRWRTTWGY